MLMCRALTLVLAGCIPVVQLAPAHSSNRAAAAIDESIWDRRFTRRPGQGP